MTKSTYLIGTSGWSYNDWRGVFYPEDCPKRLWLEYYAKNFPVVEINATFYRFFKDHVYKNWGDQVPNRFKFILKVPRLITHRKYLHDVEKPIQQFCRSAELLENKLGLLLLQLPPRMPYDPALLKEAILAFDDPKKLVVEFRNSVWFTEEIKKLLTELNCIFCSADSPATKPQKWVTSDTAYIRLHGRKKWFNYKHTEAELIEIKDLAKSMAKQGAKKIYILFNNDYFSYAIMNARRLKELLAAK